VERTFCDLGGSGYRLWGVQKTSNFNGGLGHPTKVLRRTWRKLSQHLFKLGLYFKRSGQMISYQKLYEVLLFRYLLYYSAL